MPAASGSGSGGNVGGTRGTDESGAAGPPQENSVSAGRAPRENQRAPRPSEPDRDAAGSSQQPPDLRKTLAVMERRARVYGDAQDKSVREKVADKVETLTAEGVRAASPATRGGGKIEVWVEADIKDSKKSDNRRFQEAVATRIGENARINSDYRRLVLERDPKLLEKAERAADKAQSRDTPEDVERRGRLQRSADEAREQAKQTLDAGYVVVGREYRFRTDPSRTAFRDEGKKLTTEYSTAEVVRGVVDGAQAKGWRAITVAGTEEFRQRVWLEAEARNLTVRGYAPTEHDRELLERAKKNGHRIENSVAKATDRQPTRSANLDVDSYYTRLPDGSIVDPRDGYQGSVIPPTHFHQDGDRGRAPNTSTRTPRSAAEEVIAMGASPYKFDKREEHSYYIRLKDAHGKERDVWGKDLERAASDAGVRPGDAVRLRVKEKTPVEVLVNIRDAQDKVIGREHKTARRNEWEIERVDGRKEAPVRVLDQVLDKQGASPELRERVGAAAEKEFERRRAEGSEPEVKVFDSNAARLVERAPRSVESVRPIDRGSPSRS